MLLLGTIVQTFFLFSGFKNIYGAAELGGLECISGSNSRPEFLLMNHVSMSLCP
jgi:hypothetical protein